MAPARSIMVRRPTFNPTSAEAGCNPGQTPGPEAAAAAPNGGTRRGRLHLSLQEKPSPCPPPRHPTPPPKKQIRWNNQFEILEENVNGRRREGEDNNETKVNNDGKKAAIYKEEEGKEGIMEKFRIV
ncbi:hypothetical protein ACHAWO_001208 [Cyclotella atomus]|uniref:Uncharacterized protein n=1 Tax=Cyclotella atomus TaxID=382360 RepID=A0ABD3PCN1_9STRA